MKIIPGRQHPVLNVPTEIIEVSNRKERLHPGVSDDFIHYQLKYAPFDLVKWIKRVCTKESTTTPQTTRVSSYLCSSFFVYVCARQQLLVLMTLGMAGYFWLQRDEGLKRSLYFWSKAFPIYAHYRYTEYKVKNLPEEEQVRSSC